MTSIIDDGSTAYTVSLLKMEELDTGPHAFGIAYKRMRMRWRLPEALMGGTMYMRAMGELFLPSHPAEPTDAYRYRLQRTVLRNYYKRTVATLAGKVFSKGVIFSDKAPKDLQDWANNVDLIGSDVSEFASTVFQNALAMGISYILVDFPKVEMTLNKAQEKQVGARPYWVHVTARNLISFMSERIGGVETLTEVRIHEEIIKEDEKGAQTCVPRLRIIKLGSYQILEEVGKEWKVVEEGAMTLPYIPLFPVYTLKKAFMECEPPLEDLAFMNLEHWQVRSDQRTALSAASFPILAASGWNKEQDGNIAFGPMVALTTTDPQGKFYFLESGGAHLAAGREELKDLEEQMRLFGLQFEQGGTTKAGTTATEKLIDTAEGVAPLHAWTDNLESALVAAFKCMYDWTNQKADLEDILEIDPDYGISTKDSHDVDTLMNLRKQGDLTRTSLLNELKIKTVLSEDFDVHAEIDAVEAEASNNIGAFVPGQNPGDPTQPGMTANPFDASSAPPSSAPNPTEPVPDITNPVGSTTAPVSHPETNPAPTVDFTEINARLDQITASIDQIINEEKTEPTEGADTLEKERLAEEKRQFDETMQVERDKLELLKSQPSVELQALKDSLGVITSVLARQAASVASEGDSSSAKNMEELISTIQSYFSQNNTSKTINVNRGPDGKITQLVSEPTKGGPNG